MHYSSNITVVTVMVREVIIAIVREVIIAIVIMS